MSRPRAVGASLLLIGGDPGNLAAMKRMISAALLVGLVGCQHPAANGTTPVSPAAKPASGTIEDRLARLEAAYAKNAEALDFLAKVYAQQKAQQAAQERDEPADDAVFAVEVADDVNAGQVDGPATAAVTIVKAFDFACPYCAQTAPTMEELVKDYGGKVRVVYMNMLVHPPARPAHLASCAAAKQGKYNQFKHAFWTKAFAAYADTRDPTKLGEDNILALAKDVGLNVAKLKTDMASPACSERLEADMKQLARFHVNATPTFFINGKLFGGAMPKEGFKQAIDEQLQLVAASGVPAADYYTKVVLTKGEKQFRSKADPKP
jgi:protein-disulfide isomerase